MLWNNYKEVLNEYFDLEETFSEIKEEKDTKLVSKLYQSQHIMRSRETEITDSKGCIYNNILYPKTGKNLPCLGMDLMGFMQKKVIIVFDFQHPKEHYDFDDPIIKGTMGHYLDNTDKDIRFFEPGNHFSRYIFVRKCHMDQVDEYLDDFRRYVEAYRLLLHTYNPTESNYSEYRDFDTYMRKLDPVEGYLSGKFGKEYAKQYVEDFLFPNHS